MSQTTRCPSCATLFKVVADQLRISDGWVRCGHCKQVFDASQSLQTLAAEPLLPDLHLDRLRAPPQRVVRTTAPLGNWGDLRVERSEVSASPVHAPVPESLKHEQAQPAVREPQAFEGRVLQVPDSEVPAFLAATGHFERDAADESAGPASFAWSRPPSPESAQEPAALDDPPVLAVSEGYGGASVSADSGKPVGYELPAAVLSEPDLDGLEGGVEAGPETREMGSADPSESLPQPWDDVADAHADDASGPSQAESDATSARDADGSSAAVIEGLDAPAPPHLDEAAPSLEPEPSFVRAARRQALWHKPIVRAVLGLLLVLLAAALLLQVALQQRNYLAAAWPQWRPYLETVCAPLQCRVGAYREISSVVVDSSSFNKLRGNTYQFAISLKNRSGMALEMPAVELTLTDASDEAVLRRVFMLSDLSAPGTLAARGEWTATLRIQLAPSDSARIAGYRVLAFYP